MGYQQFEDASGNPLADVPLENLLAVLPNRIEAAAVGMEENPLMEYVQAMIDRGVDPAALDTSKMDQDMADVLRLIMAMQDKESIGTEAMERLSAGLTEGTDDVEKAAREIVGRLGDKLGEPAETARAAGKNAADNLADGLAAGTPGAAAAAAMLASAVNSALQFVTPGVGIDLPGAGAAGNAVTNNSTDNSVNVTIQNANMDNPQRANNMADRLVTYSRMKNAGVGLND